MKRCTFLLLWMVLWAAHRTCPQPQAAPKKSSGVLFSEDFESGKKFTGQTLQISTDYGFTIVGKPSYAGDRAGRWELRDKDPMASDGTRAEVLFDEKYRLKETWHSFAAYFPSDHYRPDDDDESINQWHQGGEYGTPMMTVRTVNGRLKVQRRSASGHYYTVYDLGKIPYDEWVTFVIHLRQDVKNGIFQLWMNSKKKMDFRGPTMYKGPYGRWKIGIYKSDWNKKGTTETRKRIWYVDEVRFGNARASYAEMKVTPKGSGKAAAAPIAAELPEEEQTMVITTPRLLLYPNPAPKGSVLTVNTYSTVPYRLLVADGGGRVVYTTFFSGTTRLSTAGLPPGLYILNLFGSGQVKRQKFLVTH
ncbi:heparin lyase I family protein [Paraflavisolibacter sp. H34]|uniref:heparin lyase I family protein n=1 Tax=Huijunlia imazamoxiresistens TaxID=3127457 RepID=UPI0030168320